MRLDSVPASYMCVYTSTYAAEIDRRQRRVCHTCATGGAA